MALAHPCVFPIALRALVALFPLFGVPDGFILSVHSQQLAADFRQVAAEAAAMGAWLEALASLRLQRGRAFR